MASHICQHFSLQRMLAAASKRAALSHRVVDPVPISLRAWANFAALLVGILVTAGETRTSDGPPSAAELRARKVSDADPSFHRGRLCVGMTRSEPAISHSLYGPV
jgi:hypothetical protein